MRMLPLLKIESDFTLQSSGQLSTRLEAFAESLGIQDETKRRKSWEKDTMPGSIVDQQVQMW